MQNCTTEYLFEGKLKLLQPEKGYRFSIDPFLLCTGIMPRENSIILDVGCGSGIIPLILTFRHRTVKVFGVEIQKDLASLAAENVRKNGMEKNITIICKDFKKIKQTDLNEPVDIVVTNPPYKQKKSGRINPDKQKALARHELELCLSELLDTSRRLLADKGKFFIIFPAERVYDLLYNMVKNRIQPETIRFVHTKKNSPAKRVIVSGTKQGTHEPEILPPLFLYDSRNKRSLEVLYMYKT